MQLTSIATVARLAAITSIIAFPVGVRADSPHPAAPAHTVATAPSTTASNLTAASEHDGQHDFDFEIGRFKITLKRLVRTPHGTTEWVTGSGTSITRPVWDGKANLNEVEIDLPTGHLEGTTLRLYNPTSHQWSIYWANQKVGRLDVPQIGEFKDGVGEFYAQDTIDGRAVLVRFIWSKMTPTSAHFEQAFSADGGKTWEVNWITDQTRVQ